jgi:hypothetical protein
VTAVAGRPPWGDAEPPGEPVGECGHRAADATLGCKDPIHPDRLDVVGDPGPGDDGPPVTVGAGDLRELLAVADAVLFAGPRMRDAVAAQAAQPRSRARLAAARLRAAVRAA